MQSRSVIVHYQHRFAAHVDEAVEGEVGKRLRGDGFDRS
jgi:hypothetical protein